MDSVNGSEKTLLAQEKLKTNAAFVFPSRLPKFQYYAECRSCHEMKLRSTSTLVMYATRPTNGYCNVVVELPFLSVYIGLPSVFKILGVATRDDVLALVQTAGEPILEHTLRCIFDNDAQADMTRDDVLECRSFYEASTDPELAERCLSRLEPGQPLDTVMDTLPDSVALDTTGDGRVDTIKRLVNERDQYSS